MCGIAGYQGRFEAGLLAAMESCLTHRGPDGAGTLRLDDGAGSHTGLAHRRLSIIDLSAEGAQPMTIRCPACGVADEHDLALSYNGEIYNFPELRRELERQGHAFHSATDSEVLLHLYATRGLDFLDSLNGIFAFGIRDGRERGRPAGVNRGDLVIARDQIGVKPLYYATVPEGFLFASELKAILRHPSVPRDLDLVALDQAMSFLWTPAPRTALAAIRKLEPGHAMIVHRGHVARSWCYYDLPYGRPPLEGDMDVLADRVHDAVRVAVERQLLADVEVGAFLSGGLDSSAVVAMMKRARPDQRPRCYAIGFAGDRDVEGAPADLPYARRVAQHLDVDLRVLEVGPDMIDHLERMLWHLEEPQADPAPINSLLIAEAARDDGIKVLLSGAGGDDIFSGYRRHRALRAERYWSWLPVRARRALASGSALAGSRLGVRSHGTRRVVKALADAGVAADERLVGYFQWSPEHTRRGLWSADVRAALGDADARAPLLASLDRIPTERDALNRMLYLEAKHFLPDHNLNYTDKTGMAVGVEVRVPLLDLELVDLATRIPARFKQRGPVGKAVFKRAMERELPRDVIYRPKSGFGAPLRSWLRGELRDQVDELLGARSLSQRGLFDPAAVARFIRDDRAGRVDGAYTIFAMMTIEMWCRMFVDGSVPSLTVAAR